MATGCGRAWHIAEDVPGLCGVRQSPIKRDSKVTLRIESAQPQNFDLPCVSRCNEAQPVGPKW